jgi:hypothetical protein
MKKQIFLFTCVLMLAPALRAQEANKLQTLKTAFQSTRFHLSGYGQIEYNLTEHADADRPNSSLDVSRLILLLSGRLGENNQFGYSLMYDFGPTARLQELYGEWTPLASIGLRAGQCKVPFTLENPISASRIETIRFSRSASAMSGNSGDVNQFDRDGRSIGSKGGRDAGVQLSGRLFPRNNGYRFEYAAGLFNGTGLNTRDNDNHKDFVATAYWSPIPGLRLGGSLYAGKFYDISRDRRAATAEYSVRRFYGRAEYLSASDGALKREGYYASLVWKLVPERWEIVGKYDYYNSNTALKNNDISDLTAGLNYYFAPLSRLQLNYVYTDYASASTNHTLLAQLQVYF